MVRMEKHVTDKDRHARVDEILINVFPYLFNLTSVGCFITCFLLIYIVKLEKMCRFKNR